MFDYGVASMSKCASRICSTRSECQMRVDFQQALCPIQRQRLNISRANEEALFTNIASLRPVPASRSAFLESRAGWSSAKASILLKQARRCSYDRYRSTGQPVANNPRRNLTSISCSSPARNGPAIEMLLRINGDADVCSPVSGWQL